MPATHFFSLPDYVFHDMRRGLSVRFVDTLVPMCWIDGDEADCLQNSLGRERGFCQIP